MPASFSRSIAAAATLLLLSAPASAQEQPAKPATAAQPEAPAKPAPLPAQTEAPANPAPAHAEPVPPPAPPVSAAPAAQTEPARPAAPAPVDPAPKPARGHFGDAGQVALSLNEEFPVNFTDVIAANQIQASNFVTAHFSLGVMVGAQWFSSSPVSGASYSEFVFRIGPRIGYDFTLSEHVSIWPQIGIDYRRDQVTPVGATSGNFGLPTQTLESTANAFGFVAIAPVLIHPLKGFFIGAGPALYSEFSNNVSSGNSSIDNKKVTSVGLMATIGGAI